MNINLDGTLQFNDEFELFYEILNQLELEVKPGGYIYDSNNNVLAFNGKMIKASINPNQINYPGEDEIEFNPLANIRMANMLLGLYMKRKIDEGMPFTSTSTKEIDDENGNRMYNMTIKRQPYNRALFNDGEDTYETDTRYYYNKCLPYIELIFILDDQPIDLSNFDKIFER